MAQPGMAQSEIVTITIPTGSSFTYSPDPTILTIADHAIMPVAILIGVIVFMFLFFKPLSKPIARMISAEALGTKFRMQPPPPEVGAISDGAFGERSQSD
jgi:hypothetical protein